ncbi:MAG TPA: hypothetical protein DHU89_00400 [Flavobacteriales bacterium]|nr:hypothetical protein [Flavobacteriales bacterium]|tara:strand:- start:37641 stop:38927 length:1287 start_codon:yes stop_codon:yes gene_type:complete
MSNNQKTQMKNYLSLALLACFIITSCTKDKGSLTLTFTKSTAEYGNLEEIRNTELLEASRAIENPGKIYIGEEYLLIGEEGIGIHVYDNSAPSNPVNVAFMNVPFCKEFFVKDDFIYAESQYDLLKINISDFASPFLAERALNSFATPLTNDQGQQLVGFSYEEVTEKIKINSKEYEQVSENSTLYYDYTESLIPSSAVPSSFSGASSGQIGTVNRITEHMGYIYAISNRKIHVFNTNGALIKSNEIETSNNLQTIYPKGDYIFLGTQTSMDIYDVRSPEAPVEITSHWHTTACDPVLPHGDDVAYVTVRTGDFSDCPGDVNALLVLDLENITSPQERQSIDMASPYGMAIEGDILYVGNGAAGLYMYDISDRFNVTLLGTNTAVQAYDVIPHPTITNLILTSGPNGIEQYEFNQETLDLNLISHIQI